MLQPRVPQHLIPMARVPTRLPRLNPADKAPRRSGRGGEGRTPLESLTCPTAPETLLQRQRPGWYKRSIILRTSHCMRRSLRRMLAISLCWNVRSSDHR